MANLAIPTVASWLAMKVNAFSDESYGMPGQYVCICMAHVHTQRTSIPAHMSQSGLAC